MLSFRRLLTTSIPSTMGTGIMKLTFLGTGTSNGVPVIGCMCPVCTSSDLRNRRMRTSALLHVDDHHILIDVGPDFRTQALAASLHRLDAVLITHHHFDHIGGLDDLRPLTDRQGILPIYGRPDTLEDIRCRFSYAFSTTSSSEGSSRPMLELMPITEAFTIGNIRVLPFDVQHGTWTINGYRIGGLGYVTDASALPPASRSLLSDLDVLVINALRQEPHPTHFSLDEACAVIQDVRPRRAFLVHMTHRLDHATINDQLPPGVELAYDGLVVDIASSD